MTRAVTIEIAGEECKVEYIYTQFLPATRWEPAQEEEVELNAIYFQGADITQFVFEPAYCAGVGAAVEDYIKARVIAEHHREIDDAAQMAAEMQAEAQDGR